MFLVLKNSLVPMTLTCRMYFQKYFTDLVKDWEVSFFLSFEMFVLDIFGFCDKRLIETFCVVLHLQ